MRPSVSTTSPQRDLTLKEARLANVLGVAGLHFIASALRWRANVAVHLKAAGHLTGMAIACRNLVEFPEVEEPGATGYGTRKRSYPPRATAKVPRPSRIRTTG
jgi:NCAIR mutase (PurE)-related protein